MRLVQIADMMWDSTLQFHNEIHAMSTGLRTTLSESNRLLHEEVQAVSSSLTTTETLSQRQLESSQLLSSEIRALTSQLRSNTALSREELVTGLGDLGSQIMYEVSVAITFTSEWANALNQVSLQTIVNLLQNQQNVQPGINPASSSMITQLSVEENPKLEE